MVGKQTPPACWGYCVLAHTADLLVEHGVIQDDSYVASILARWDRTVPTGRVNLEVRSSLPPEMRLSSETRKKIAAGNGRRTYTTAPAEVA